MKGSFKWSDALLCHIPERASHTFPFLWINRITLSQASKTTIHYDLWFFMRWISTCHTSTYFIICILSFGIVLCVYTWWRDVFFSSVLPLSELGPNFSQFEPIFPKEEAPIVLVIYSSVLLPPLLFLPSLLRSATIRFVTEQVDWSLQCSSSTYKWSQDLFIVTRAGNL